MRRKGSCGSELCQFSSAHLIVGIPLTRFNGGLSFGAEQRPDHPTAGAGVQPELATDPFQPWVHPTSGNKVQTEWVIALQPLLLVHGLFRHDSSFLPTNGSSLYFEIMESQPDYL